MSNPVVHFEIPANDLGRAQAFYRDTFGWAINPIPDLGYTLVMTAPTDEQGRLSEAGAINGGMLERQGPVTAPIITVEVDDIDAALRQIEGNGGKTVQARQPVGELGYSAYFADSEGNVLGLWQDAESE
jgi:predicted enzyme related to lactoylglutathione lyase